MGVIESLAACWSAGVARVRRASSGAPSCGVVVMAATAVLAGTPAEGQTGAAKSEADVEMSPISGDPSRPRRHSRLRNPADLDPADAEEIYEIAMPSLGIGYQRSRHEAASYQGWRRYNAAPYLSSTHGNHYINNYANEKAAAYGRYEAAGKFPVGAILAKDSFAVTETGGILLGPLFLMTKMPAGFNHSSGDWRYTVVQPDGTFLGETNGLGSKRVAYCIGCHLAREAYDHLYFIPEAYRRR